jgi:hypothetical protein
MERQVLRLYNNPAVTHAVNVLTDHAVTPVQYLQLAELLLQDRDMDETVGPLDEYRGQ